MVSARLASVAEAADKAVSALKDRNIEIMFAHREGASIRAIAAAASLSPARVHQILHGR